MKIYIVFENIQGDGTSHDDIVEVFAEENAAAQYVFNKNEQHQYTQKPYWFEEFYVH